MEVKHYDNSFKEQAIKLSNQRGNVNSIARELWISGSQLVARTPTDPDTSSFVLKKFI